MRRGLNSSKRATSPVLLRVVNTDRKSTRLNSSHLVNSYAVFCLKKKTHTDNARGSSTEPRRRSKRFERAGEPSHGSTPRQWGSPATPQARASYGQTDESQNNRSA